MKQEDRELLLKDLSARLLYGVKIQTDYTDAKTLEGIQFPDYIGISDGYYSLDDMECKPYLFPLSSMTDEQEEKYNNLNGYELGCFPHTEEALDYLIANHFDYRSLIKKGLAIDATNLNIY